MQKADAFAHLGQNLQIHYLKSSDLKPFKSNARTHSKKQIQQIADSMHEFGFTNPILIDADHTIIAGHGRLEAAKLVGIHQVPIIYLRHLTEAQKRAYIIADNKLAENAGWDFEILQSEIQTIADLDLDLDLTLTGFEIAEIDGFMMGNQASPEEPSILNLPNNPVSQLGDLWYLGEHILYCGDATKSESYERLMESERAQAIFTDPPYNVPVNGHICGNGKVKHDEFKMASGEMSEEEFTRFLKTAFQNLKEYSINGSLHYICMDWRHIKEITKAGEIYDDFKNLCIWNKTNGGMGSLYRSKHELVFVYKNGTEPHINNVELGKHGRYRTNVWDYAGVNTFQNNKDLELHPTVKPVIMIEDAILDCTKRGDIVLDVFGGSGSSLIAAERAGRKARLIELDPKYVDVIIQRYKEETLKVAVHEDGQTFDQKKGEHHDG